MNPGNALSDAGFVFYFVKGTSNPTLLYQQGVGTLSNNAIDTTFATTGRTFITMSFDFSAANEMLLFANGSLLDTTGLSPQATNLLFNQLPIWLGQVPKTDGDNNQYFPFDGDLKDISIFRTAFDLTDHQNAYNSGTPNDLRSHAQADYLMRYRRPEGSTRPVLRDRMESGHNIIMTSETG